LSRSIDIAPGTVDVWESRLDVTDAALDVLARILSPDERVRAEDFHDLRSRRQYVVSRAMLRQILAKYTGGSHGEIRFTTIGDGKPALAEPNELQLQFNMSHSGSLALFAVTSGRDVGIDVEQIRSVPKALELARRFFSAEEARPLSMLEQTERDRAFLSLWVKREAHAKALGVSIWRSLASNDEASGCGEWSTQIVSCGPGYVGAVAARGTQWRIVRRDFADRRD